MKFGSTVIDLIGNTPLLRLGRLAYWLGEDRKVEAKQVLTNGIAAAERMGNQHARSEMEALLTELS